MFISPAGTAFDGMNSYIFHNYNGFELNPFTNWFASSIVVFVQLFLINRMSIKNGYDKQLSLFPGLFYAILVSLFPEYLALSPALIANTFIVLSLMEINKLYKKIQPVSILFNAGFFGAIAFLIYLPTIVLLPILVIGMFSLRAQDFKEFLQMISGFIMVLFLGWAYGFIYWEDYSLLNYFNFSFGLPEIQGIRPYLILVSILVSSFLMVAMRRPIFIKKSIQSTKKIVLFYWFMILSSLVIIIGSNQEVFFKLLIVWIPLGILLGLFVANIKSKLIAEFLHLILLLILINVHFDLLSFLT